MIRTLIDRFRRDERGDFLPAILVLITAVLLVIGFTVDAGRLLAARRELNDTASQAAIAGAQQVDGRSIIAGQAELGPSAITAANAYLSSVSATGSSSISGDQIEVETNAEFSPIMFFGFRDMTVDGRGTARAVRGVDTAES